jgi:hypothetical protein
MGESPILYNRVKNAKKVKTRGAMMNSHSSRNCKNVCSFYYRGYISFSCYGTVDQNRLPDLSIQDSHLFQLSFLLINLYPIHNFAIDRGRWDISFPYGLLIKVCPGRSSFGRRHLGILYSYDLLPEYPNTQMM